MVEIVIALLLVTQLLIIKQNRSIMEKQSEQVEKLNTALGKLDTALGVITKVSGETDGLKGEITRLNEVIAGLGDNATPELVAAATAVTEKANAVFAAITLVDEKVEDAPVATPGEETPPTEG